MLLLEQLLFYHTSFSTYNAPNCCWCWYFGLFFLTVSLDGNWFQIHHIQCYLLIEVFLNISVDTNQPIHVFQQPSRSFKKVHNFGKRSNSIKRNPNAPVVKSNWLYKQVQQAGGWDVVEFVWEWCTLMIWKVAETLTVIVLFNAFYLEDKDSQYHDCILITQLSQDMVSLA